jgi:hypothetical protein
MKRRHFIKQTVAGTALSALGTSLCWSRSAATLEPKKILELAGTSSSRPDNFTRRFPGLPKQGLKNPRLEEGLIELAKKMKEDVDQPPNTENMPPMAGYTYLGQFIDHDLTLDLTPLDDAGHVKVEQTQNFRTPFLDLDHLYGGGPNLSPFLYENKEEYRRAERFLIGKTVTADGRDGSENDLPRSPQGIALAGDPRQDENLILAQLHVAFLKAHNAVLNKPDELKKSPYYEQAGSPFAAAQRVLKWHYQWIVRHDFLKQVLDATVFEQMEGEESRSRRDGHANFQIPVEFSMAAFRFGHSMVRNNYRINGSHAPIDLVDLLKLTGPGGGSSFRLDEGLRIDWRYFLAVVAPGSAQHSEVIDARIAGGLYELPVKTRELFNVPTTDSEQRLPVRTLLRGARAGLPSGQRVAEKLKCEVLHGSKIAVGSDAEEAAILKKYAFLEDTPLWYYILKEAEILGKHGRLGPTGSRLIGDVIMSSLKSDPTSYLSVAKDSRWLPTLPLGQPKTDKSSFDISDLVRFAS